MLCQWDRKCINRGSILNTERMNTSNCAISSEQLQHKFQSARRSRSDVETDNAKGINPLYNTPAREEGEVTCRMREKQD